MIHSSGGDYTYIKIAFGDCAGSARININRFMRFYFDDFFLFFLNGKMQHFFVFGVRYAVFVQLSLLFVRLRQQSISYNQSILLAHQIIRSLFV